MQCGNYTICNTSGRGWLKIKPEGFYKLSLCPALLHFFYLSEMWNFRLSGTICLTVTVTLSSDCTSHVTCISVLEIDQFYVALSDVLFELKIGGKKWTEWACGLYFLFCIEPNFWIEILGHVIEFSVITADFDENEMWWWLSGLCVMLRKLQGSSLWYAFSLSVGIIQERCIQSDKN
jgi:hypothetical protein